LVALQVEEVFPNFTSPATSNLAAGAVVPIPTLPAKYERAVASDEYSAYLLVEPAIDPM
jgi:hypothetical protein